MAQGGSNNKIANNLVSASCAAVLAVYVAGYSRTESAANQFTAQVAERRVAGTVPSESPYDRALVRLTPAPPPAAFSPAPTVSSRSETTPPVASDAAPAGIVIAPEPAAEPTPPPPEIKADVATPAQAASMWKDGTYTGWGYSRHGNIEASVVIEGGRIASAVISQCRTRYSCSVIDRLPPEVAERQSPDVDYVSGATQSADAFYGGVFAALNKAK